MPHFAKPKEQLPPVFVTTWDSSCGRCKGIMQQGSLFMYDNDVPVCPKCAGISDLAVLRSGMGELTRLAGNYSPRKFAVLCWSDTYERWDRIGLLAEPQGIARAAREMQERLVTTVESQMLATDALFRKPVPKNDDWPLPPPPPIVAVS